MTDTTDTPSEIAVAAEDEGFYHESALNATWTGSRLAIGGLTFLFGAFLFAYFYLRSLNSSGRWQGYGFIHPSLWIGTTIMLLAEVSAGVHYFGLQRIKAGHKSAWQINGLIALGLGLAAVSFQIYQLIDLPFKPGSSGLRQRLHRLLPGVPGDPAGRADLAGDPAGPVPVHPGPVVRRTAPHVH